MRCERWIGSPRRPRSRRTRSCWRVRPSVPGRLSWSRGRRNAAGFVATCTTASARRSPHWPCTSRPRATSRRTIRRRLGKLLDRLVPRLNAAVADVRALVHELRPPMLDELGLAAAVRELGDRLSTGTTKVQVSADEIAGLPAAVEVAAYHIAGEATGNAVRHAGAGHRRGPGPGRRRLRADRGRRRRTRAARARCGPESGRRRCGSGPRSSVVSCDIDSGPAGTTVTALLPKGAS